MKLLRSEEHTSELQSLTNLVCRLLLEKKKKNYFSHSSLTIFFFNFLSLSFLRFLNFFVCKYNSLAIKFETSPLHTSFKSQTEGLKFISITEGLSEFKISTPQKSAPIALAESRASFFWISVN